jgi:predicted SAM-dependent methyltransferase
MHPWSRIKSALATPLLRRLLRRPNFKVAREQLARRYLRGDGIEVGAMSEPLPLPDGARVRYVDYKPAAALRTAETQKIREPDIISDLESMVGIADSSVDFVVANHVLEHVENPLRALGAVSRVLRRSGTAFIALPDKRYTYDKPRSVTPLQHILRDFRDGPEWSRHGHFRDWTVHVERVRGEQAVEQRACELERDAVSIHFHVWDPPAMRQMFEYAASAPDTRLVPEHTQQNRHEVIWILRKS